MCRLTRRSTIQGAKKYRLCVASYLPCRGIVFVLITTYINEQVNRPSFLMTTLFLLSMGECVMEAECDSMCGGFQCATAADIFFSMTKSGMEEGQSLGICNQKI